MDAPLTGPVNTDAEANLVSKAGYAVIGDLHEVVPTITAEIERRLQTTSTPRATALSRGPS